MEGGGYYGYSAENRLNDSTRASMVFYAYYDCVSS